MSTEPMIKSPAPDPQKNLLQRSFESLLWSTRFLVVMAVIFSLVASAILFVVGSLDIVDSIQKIWSYYVYHDTSIDIHGDLVGSVIGAIDIYLIAVVLLIFSFGLYELFISDLDPARQHHHTDGTFNLLQITSLDSLKNKIAQVIVMALIVKYFQMVLGMKFHNALEMIYLALSILSLALAVFFLNYHQKK